MTVRELKEALAGMDEKLIVFIYADVWREIESVRAENHPTRRVELTVEIPNKPFLVE